MATIRLHRAMLAVPLSYRTKVVVLAAAATVVPLIGFAAASESAPIAIAWAAAGSVLALLALLEILRPVGVIASVLRRCVGALAEAGPRPADEAVGMLRDLASLEAELTNLRGRGHAGNPISGLPPREAFLAGLDLEGRERPGALGLVKLTDYDRLAAFDQAAADAALSAFAQRLVAAIGEAAPVGHVDRDGFAFWLDAVSTPKEAGTELRTLMRAIADEIAAGEVTFTPNITAAAAVFPQDGQDAAALLTRAYAALPQPGQAAGARIGLFSSQTAAQAKERFSLQQGLRHAIARDELFLQFQPVVDLAGRRVAGAEALLRWRHPDLGLVSPAAFIPIVEQSGLMEEVGMWVLDAACREARVWRDAGRTDLKMAVNLSAKQLRQGELLPMVVRTLERHGLEPDALELELTESAAMVDDEGTRTILAGLRALGVTVAIDDFGTGYSSLSNLRKLPFTKLKIDREFVAAVDANRDNHAICSSLVELAKGLQIGILAEGAETLDEVETLRALGCSMFQGFFFSRPLTATDFASTIADPDWLALIASPVHRELSSLHRRVGRQGPQARRA